MAELLGDLPDPRTGRLVVPHVEGAGEDGAAGGADQWLGRRHPVGHPVAEGHPRPEPGEELGGGPSETLPGAGHHRDPVVQQDGRGLDGGH